MYRQQRQTRSRMGMLRLKCVMMFPSRGKISWQYLTAGCSWPGGNSGLTISMKIVMRLILSIIVSRGTSYPAWYTHLQEASALAHPWLG
jgi:hypothetical protein